MASNKLKQSVKDAAIMAAAATHPKRVVIVGGVAGGASACARLRRLDEKAEITIVERGPHISFANCGMPYHLSGVIADRAKLELYTPKSFTARFNAQTKTNTEAVKILAEEKKLRVREMQGPVSATKPAKVMEYDIPFDFLVLSPGAQPWIPDIPGKSLPGVFTLRNLVDMDRIKAFVTDNQVKRAVICGAGFIGVEVAENLVHMGIETTILEKFDQVMGPMDYEIALQVEHELRRNNVRLVLGQGVKAITSAEPGEGKKMLHVEAENGEKIPAELVLFAAGVRPETELAKTAGLTIGPAGGIQVDDQMRTSNPSIFAIGDAVEYKDRIGGGHGRVALAGPANRAGRMVADVIHGLDVKFPGTLGTGILKAFEVTAAMVGLTEKRAKQNKIPHKVAWIQAASHASYYPGAETLLMKIVFSPEDGKILGAQAVGRDGADKRIDVLATSIYAGLTVYDLQYIDLAYSPQFSSAKDPVNHLGAVAADMLLGLHPSTSWEEAMAMQRRGPGTIAKGGDFYFLDVRTRGEYEKGTIKGSTLVPLDELRENLEKIPKDKPVIVFCRVGLRGFLATRILKLHGFDNVVNLQGGYLLYSSCDPEYTYLPGASSKKA